MKSIFVVVVHAFNPIQGGRSSGPMSSKALSTETDTGQPGNTEKSCIERNKEETKNIKFLCNNDTFWFYLEKRLKI